MMIIAKLVALCAAVLVIALAHATAQAQPSQQSLVEAWERLQRSDPETLAFEKIAERRYRFKTSRFPFDGELKILKATIDDSLADYEYGHVHGVIEYDLVGLSEEVVKKYGHSYESWEENNGLTFDKESSSWMSPEQLRVRSAAKVRQATRSQEEAKAGEERARKTATWINIAAWWGPVLVLLVFWGWFLRKTGIRRQREYMNAATVHMQNVEGLLERIAEAVEGNQRQKG
jgi:hypothetical protein